MPSRSTFQSVYEQDKITYTHWGDSVSYLSSQSSSTKSWTDSVTFGDNIPDWRECLRRGDNATTSMQGSKSELRVTPGRFMVRRVNQYGPYGTTEATGKLRLALDLPVKNPSDLSVTNADNLALGKFAQKVSLAQTAIQGGVVLGELRQTLQLIRNPALGLRRQIDDWLETARRIRAQRRLAAKAAHLRRIASDIADSWLEVQFGWKPLLSDIEAACLALHRYKSGQSVSTRRVTATETQQDDSPTQRSLQGEVLAFWYAHLHATEYRQVTYRGAVRVEAHDPKQLDPRLIGFNPGQFLPTAWELLPYSFLVDYFSNIGGIIYGWSNLFTQLAWANRTTRQRTEMDQWTSVPDEYYKVNQPGDQRYTVSMVPARIVSSRTLVSRAKYTGTGVPGLAFKIPGFGSLKWLNVAALIASRKADRKWTFD